MCYNESMKNIPITQSELWRDLQNALGTTSFFQKTTTYQYLAILQTTPVGNYLYLPYGPVYRDQNAFFQALESLQKLAKKHQAIFIRVEPMDPNFAAYAPIFAKKSTDLSPKETWQLDLTGDEAALKSKLPSRLLRYYKSASKKGITLTTSHDPEDIYYLVKLQRALASKKGINTFSEDYLRTELAQPFATLYLLHFEGQVQAAGLVFDDATTRYNLQGAQSERGRSLHATGILTIQLILDAAKKGLTTFDFWGIAPENASKNHPWAGFTAFKKTFAGHEVDYAGTYDLVLAPAQYRLYQFTRALNRLRRHL